MSKQRTKSPRHVAKESLAEVSRDLRERFGSQEDLLPRLDQLDFFLTTADMAVDHLFDEAGRSAAAPAGG